MKERVITAIIFGAVLLPLVFIGGWPLMLLAYFFATVGLYELLRMKGFNLFSLPGLISTFILWMIMIPTEFYFAWLIRAGVGKTDILVLGVLLLLTYTVLTKNRVTYDDIAFMLISTIYIGFGFHYFLETRAMENGLIWIFFSLFIIWASDSGAYFFGKAFGKRKLWPDISPNKTIEGSIGGVISSVVVACLFLIFTDISEPAFLIILMTCLLAIFGQVGDLAESAFKRHYGVKDSGRILPGHGGILDRFDSLLFVWPFMYIILSIM
ncbi:phosphatidate cytidylyltransferase [Cytobacillus sp. FSL R7-0696]|uniref:phosphatidate cytidylyltransferase n=1 Tax=Cytobacillus sp. FSL R7-0696 TaxID=2921691 RepID=UPI0030FA33F7